MDTYIDWLKEKDQPLYQARGIYWRRYQNALVPASPMPQPSELTERDARDLLRESGALMLRYFTRISERPTSFWFTACSDYDFKKLPRKLRTQIRRAYKDCRVEQVDPTWLADNGYDCYTAAFSRYRNARPESREDFDKMCRGSLGGPFDFWATFVGNNLAGFYKYAVGHDYAAGLVLKLDPRFLSLNPASALQDTILTKYVGEQKKTVSVGFRSLVHDTNMHEFLTKFGYRRVYCDLKVVYRPSLRTFVNLSYLLRSFVKSTEDSQWRNKLAALWTQEEIRRSFISDGKRTTRSCEPILHRIVRSIWGNRYGTTVK